MRSKGIQRSKGVQRYGVSRDVYVDGKPREALELHAFPFSEAMQKITLKEQVGIDVWDGM